MEFKDCQLIDPILQALTEQGYTEPTAIQAGAIPPALEGRDVLGIARTGTGKTCAFATPILQRLHQKSVPGRPIRALVLTPTRELAIQNQECFESYGAHLPLRSVVIFGGVGQNPQVEALKQGADILVATPGRLADLYQQKLLDLSRLEIFVLDEADRMLDMGFIHDVKRILTWLPRRKQTLFFSATMPKEITELVEGLLHRPVRVAVDPVNTTVDAIAQTVYQVDRNNKTRLLVQLLAEKELPSVLVFTRTKHGANKVARDLEKAGISAAAIHGNKSQTARQQALSSFKEGRLQVLVATDIAARGLDIEDLSCVVNYNLPEVPETYVHRIGRTGRAGREGIAIALCDYQELPLLKDIEKLIKKRIPKVKDHPWPMQNFEEPVRDKHGKIVNPEDEEARAAAREHRYERREKRPDRPDKPGRAAPTRPTEKLPAQEEKRTAAKPVPQKAEQREGPLVGVVPIPDLLPTKEERALREQQNERSYDPEDLLRRTTYRRPERKVIPSLSQVSLLPQVELKEAFVRKSDLLDMDRPVKQLPREDATARLFSKGRESEERTAPVSAPQAEKVAAQRKKRKKKGKPEGAPKQTKQSAPVHKPSKKPAAKPAPDQAAPKGGRRTGKPEESERRVVFTVAQEEKKRRDRGRPSFSEARGGAHQKDSTEQKTLMKPYYLSDRRKG